jgi:integrase
LFQNSYQLQDLFWIEHSVHSPGRASHDPFEALTLPKCYDTDPDFYTADETRAIIAAAEGQFETLYWIAAETGMRAGELSD